MRACIAGLMKRFHRDQSGLTTVEYAIVLCLIAAMSVGLWQKFGSNVRGYLEKASETIDNQVKPAAEGGG